MNNVRLYLFGSPHIEYQGNLVRIERRKTLALAAYLECAVFAKAAMLSPKCPGLTSTVYTYGLHCAEAQVAMT